MSEAPEHQRGHAVAAGGGLIVGWPRPVQQLLVVVRGKEETPQLRIAEVPEQHLHQCHRQFQVLASPARLQQLQDTVGEKHVIVQVGVQLAASLPGGDL